MVFKKSSKSLIVGDLMLDKYICGNVERVSPEAPVPVVHVDKEILTLGGAANVVNNLCGLGIKPFICGMVGSDINAGQILSMLSEKDLLIDGIIIDGDRPTTIKTRIIGNNQQIVRVDYEKTNPVNDRINKSMLEFVQSKLKNIGVIIISDYGKGVVSRQLIVKLIKLVDGSIPIIVDPHVTNFKYYIGVTGLTPNHHEAGVFCGFKLTNDDRVVRAGDYILDKLKCEYVLITRGSDGMTLCTKSDVFHISTVAQEVYDVSGAGDTVISVFAYGLTQGLSLFEAAKLSNKAAGIVVGERGTSIITKEKLL
jgi:D-beta-D-heptose 7-phosphate kinase/D-beta-D-heptose 1-phosphate adenosyltransferase